MLIKAQGDYPLVTAVTSELILHTEALQILFKGEQPLMLPICPTNLGKLFFFIGDTTQEGLGELLTFLTERLHFGKGYGVRSLLKEGPTYKWHRIK